jgi:4'-phosphopantetheinyl transferase EntD
VAGPEAIDALKQVAIDAAELECLLTAVPKWSLELLLTAAFSAKESFYKGAFSAVGRFFGFEAVRLRFVDEQRKCLGFAVVQPLAAAFPVGHSFEVGFDVIAPGTVLTHFTW